MKILAASYLINP